MHTVRTLGVRLMDGGHFTLNGREAGGMEAQTPCEAARSHAGGSLRGCRGLSTVASGGGVGGGGKCV